MICRCRIKSILILKPSTYLLKAIPQEGSREFLHNAFDHGIDNELAVTWKRKGLDHKNLEGRTIITSSERRRYVVGQIGEISGSIRH
jgi:hypothetical protein